jgi:hypothetical protein
MLEDSYYIIEQWKDLKLLCYDGGPFGKLVSKVDVVTTACRLFCSLTTNAYATTISTRTLHRRRLWSIGIVPKPKDLFVRLSLQDVNFNILRMQEMGTDQRRLHGQFHFRPTNALEKVVA